jgi:hypothetical protein
MLVVLALAAVAFRVTYVAVANSAREQKAPIIRRTLPPLVVRNTQIEARKPLAQYQDTVNPNLFNPAEPPPSLPRIAPTPTPPRADSIATSDPVDEYVYSGIATIGNRKYVLLESRFSKSGHYLSLGDHFLGGRLMKADEGRAVFKFGSNTKVLRLRQDYSLVPLDRSAAFLTAKPPPTPATPVQQPAAAPPAPQPAATQTTSPTPVPANQPPVESGTATPIPQTQPPTPPNLQDRE